MTRPLTVFAIALLSVLAAGACNTGSLSGGSSADSAPPQSDGPKLFDDGPSSPPKDGPPSATDGPRPDGAQAQDSAPPQSDGPSGQPDATPTDSAAPLPDLSQPDAPSSGVVYNCPTPTLSGATTDEKYNSFWDGRGRPQTDSDMGWTQDPSLLDVINTVRFGPPPPGSSADLSLLRDLTDFVPANHNQTTQSNLSLFKSLNLTGSSDAYTKFNPRDYIPASMTRYGSLMASQWVKWHDHEWTKLALARCPDCIDGIVTLSAVPHEQVAKHHDFFKVFEVRFVTDLAVDATNPTDRMKASSGKLFVSKPFKLLAAIDSSGALYQHISNEFRPFQSTPYKDIKLRYRGEIGNHLYNLIQTGDAAKVNPWVTGTVAILLRYAADNDKSLGSVCPWAPLPAGVDPITRCNLMQWGTWRCGPYGSLPKDAVQICKLSNGEFKWLTSHFESCAICKVDPILGCTYAP